MATMDSGPNDSIIARWYDVVDGVVEANPEDLLADGFYFEMVYPAMGDAPAERIVGGIEEYRRFRHQLYSRPEGPPTRASGSERRHHIRTIKEIDGVELMLGTATGGRRQGTILAAAQKDEQGRMTCYLWSCPRCVSKNEVRWSRSGVRAGWASCHLWRHDRTVYRSCFAGVFGTVERARSKRIQPGGAEPASRRQMGH